MPNGKTSCFVDTNLIVYTMDPAEKQKRLQARDFLNRMIDFGTPVLSPQSLNELYRVLTEKRGLMARHDAQTVVWAWNRFCTAPYDFDVTQRAWEIHDRTNFGWWDSMLLASASLAGCEFFMSEDLGHGQSIAGLTVLDPFKLDQNAFFQDR